jgi:hypothetical protein
MRHRRAILTFFVLLLSKPGLAVRHLAPEKWQQYKTGKAYTYATEREVFRINESAPEKNFLLKLLYRLANLFSGNTGLFLLWTIISLVAALVILMVVRNYQVKGKKIHAAAADTPVTGDDIVHTNWANLQQQAMQRGEMKLAVRYSFMWLLQLLQERSMIDYRKDKTNYDYYRELAGTALSRDFRQLSARYEYVWYGQFTLTNDDCSAYLELFNRLRRQLTER